MNIFSTDLPSFTINPLLKNQSFSRLQKNIYIVVGLTFSILGIAYCMVKYSRFFHFKKSFLGLSHQAHAYHHTIPFFMTPYVNKDLFSSQSFQRLNHIQEEDPHFQSSIAVTPNQQTTMQSTQSLAISNDYLDEQNDKIRIMTTLITDIFTNYLADSKRNSLPFLKTTSGQNLIKHPPMIGISNPKPDPMQDLLKSQTERIQELNDSIKQEHYLKRIKENEKRIKKLKEEIQEKEEMIKVIRGPSQRTGKDFFDSAPSKLLDMFVAANEGLDFLKNDLMKCEEENQKISALDCFKLKPSS